MCNFAVGLLALTSWPRRADYSEASPTKLYEAGIGWEQSRHIKAFTDALFETYRNLANLRYCCLEHCNVDATGVIFYQSRGDLISTNYSHWGQQDVLLRSPIGCHNDSYGVGSDVVCSTAIGMQEPRYVEWTAGRFHAFLMSLSQNIISGNWTSGQLWRLRHPHFDYGLRTTT